MHFKKMRGKQGQRKALLLARPLQVQALPGAEDTGDPRPAQGRQNSPDLLHPAQGLQRQASLTRGYHTRPGNTAASSQAGIQTPKLALF